MGKKNTSNKYNSYASFEDSIISIAKNELKQDCSKVPEKKGNSSNPKRGATVGGGLFGAAIGAHGAAIGGIAGAIVGGIGAAISPGAAVGGAIEFGITESYYSEDLEKRYRDYIKANYEMEFSKHKNDVPYIQSLIARAVKAVKELMSTSSSSAPVIMGSPIGIGLSALYSDSDNNENEK